MEVDGEPRGSRKSLKNLFKGGNHTGISIAEDQSVVCILQDRARGVMEEGMREGSISLDLTDQKLYDVYNDDEDVGREGVALPRTILTTNPVTRDTI